jgi:long-subunit acyl-CoA synthetase (AMP-forming)
VVVLAKDFAASHTNIEEVLRQLLDEINAQVEIYERLAFLVVTDEPWSVANGILTPTLKLKRSVLEEHYARYFDQWANQKTRIVWHRGSSSACA